MPTMSDEEFRQTQRQIRDGLARLTRRKLRHMRARMTKPRTYRLPKAARALKSIVAEAKILGCELRTRPALSGRAASRRAHPRAPGK